MHSYIEKLCRSFWLYPAGLVLGLLQAIAFDFPFESIYKFVGVLCSTFSLLGFLSIIQKLQPKAALFFGYSFGLGLFGWGLNWLYISMATFGGAPFIFSIAANALVVAYLSLYWLLGAYLITKLGKTTKQRLMLAPAIIALLEWVRSVFLIGFPWLSLGYAWIETPLTHLASYIGVFGLSFAIIALLATFLAFFPRYPIRTFLAIVILFSLFLFPRTFESKKSIKVALVQGNMPVITEYNTKRMNQNLVQYHLLTEKILKNEKPDIVIWPEAAIPYFYIESLDFLNDIKVLQKKHGFDLITGIPHTNWKDKAIYNSVLLQTSNVRNSPQFYHKSHLLPFGEYLPFRFIFSFFKEIVDIPMSDFSRGKKIQEPFEVAGIKFSTSICFEAVFGDEIRLNAKNAEVLLNVSNDAWFGRSKAQIQHLNIARMRAIENQKMMVRATNDGRTAFIMMNGKITSSLKPFTANSISETIYANNQITLYSKYGDALILIVVLLLIIAIFLWNQLIYYQKRENLHH